MNLYIDMIQIIDRISKTKQHQNKYARYRMKPWYLITQIFNLKGVLLINIEFFQKEMTMKHDQHSPLTVDP